MSTIATNVTSLPGINSADASQYTLLNAALLNGDGNTHIVYVDRRLWVNNTIQFTANVSLAVCTIWASLDTLKWFALTPTVNTDGGMVVLPPGNYGFIGVSRDGTTSGTVTAVLASSGYLTDI